MRLKRLELSGFKSFAKPTEFLFDSPITAIVGPNGSGKSNSAEAFRWVLGERSLKSLRGQKGEDLIFNGTGGRSNRAVVSLVFDNSDRYFNFDYDEVKLTREVYRDGQNVYAVNGTIVRYRDLTELLAGVSLGASDHYIINQGEADRVLSANPRERRALVEDALGLRLYQWKIAESEKKLEQTKNNLNQVMSLRREIAPHLRFLKKQMEKVEQADQLRRDLKGLYLEYLKREESYLIQEKKNLIEERQSPEGELREIVGKLAKEKTTEETEVEVRIQTNRVRVENELRNVVMEKEKLSRQLGRVEGMIELKREAMTSSDLPSQRDFSFTEVSDLFRRLEQEIGDAGKLSDVFSIRNVLRKITEVLKNFLQQGREKDEKMELTMEMERLEAEQKMLALGVADLNEKEEKLEAEKLKLERELASTIASVREAEREIFNLKTRRQELESKLNLLDSRAARLRLEETNFQSELNEARVLVDQEVALYKNFVLADVDEKREEQEKRRHQLERLKIKLEDLGIESGDTIKEYREVSERDIFLSREIADLEAAGASLRVVIAELVEKIEHEFREGLSKINKQFQDFFSLMFGGGTADLSIVKQKLVGKTGDEAGDVETGEEASGLDIRINLPRKKIRGLEMLSGGERALVSIALLFALSQVNPPPFLVLDETDAALDEANSRKYGDMVANLAKHSQLILITHNRETMSRAGVLYGVTMNTDGVSKLLSIKFDDATQFAK
ncbi:AAA family ATPase [Candidatus Nomurabacteria bacterium]|nr:AAA family ATPase [Candidatus Nomurabacteria bacterium]